MNNIPRPTVDDHQALESLANNRRAASFPHLQTSVAIIRDAYTQYEAVLGNACEVLPVPLPAPVTDYLKGHFKSPTRDLQHITEIRKAEEHLLCPMCGSSHRGTLDHLLPQDSHGAFAVFSLNLVPACKCNSLRQTLLTGLNPGERILHPYFDTCLSERLVTAQFEDLGSVPKISLRLCVDDTHSKYAAIRFHVCSVVERTSIHGFLSTEWAKLCRKPSLRIRALKTNPTNRTELMHLIEEELESLDDEHGGRNNWHSIFIGGLLDPVVLDWMDQSIHGVGRLPDGPLI
ncbi:hypothetical protein ACTACT_21865 [Pseudomonas syringae]|uniref:hypothetical protein n=1 Tax=Pseudomonas syringae TaxID=317 RepID=UPI003F754A6A